MPTLIPTLPDKMFDAQGRPYFLWDCDMDATRFLELIRGEDADLRAHYIARMMRQAKPDDVFEFVSQGDILRDWDRIEPHLGQKRSFWTWLKGRWLNNGEAA